MFLLAIDTAGPNCAAAVARARPGGGQVIARAERRVGRGHAEVLMQLVESALHEAKIGYLELRRVAVTTGPGSFTGVRVGVAAARGLALALGIEAVGIGSLAALVRPIAQNSGAGMLVGALKVGRGEVCIRVVNLASGEVQTESSAIPIDEAVFALGQPTAPLILTGSGAPELAAALGRSDLRIVRTAEYPDIADVAALGFQGGRREPPLPTYARAADAKPQSDAAMAHL
jgi:tRNA threonylcarbamoyladenosine biosynthesis protein TsaB